MARPENGWGGPSYSQDIADNYMNTHHEDENGVMIANDEDYLNSKYEDNLSVSDDVVRFSNHYLAYDDNYISPDANEDLDYGFEKDEDGFYIIPDNDVVFEFWFDGHGNYMDDDYFFKRDYEGESCSLFPDEDEECPF